MKKFYAGRLLVPYILLFHVFRSVFSKITGYYLKAECMCNPKTNYPIDVAVEESHKLFNVTYVREAASNCYIAQRYYSTFLPLDLVFPFVYSFLFLTMINLAQIRKRKNIFVGAVILGGVFDVMEDISFATYLTNHADGLAVATAIFTTIKSIFFVGNIISFLILFWKWAREAAVNR